MYHKPNELNLSQDTEALALKKSYFHAVISNNIDKWDLLEDNKYILKFALYIFA